MIKVCTRCGKKYTCAPGSEAEKDGLCGICFRIEDVMTIPKTTVINNFEQHKEVQSQGVRAPLSQKEATDVSNATLLKKTRIETPDENIAESVLLKKGLLDEQRQKIRQQMLRQQEKEEVKDTLMDLKNVPRKTHQRAPVVGEYLFGDEELWMEGFCEDCGNYQLLHFEDGLYLCHNCRRSGTLII